MAGTARRAADATGRTGAARAVLRTGLGLLLLALAAGCGEPAAPRARAAAPAPGGVVFLGDSLTRSGPWEALFPGVRVRNLGVKGDTVDGLIARLAEVEEAPPDKLFLEIGTNDVRGDRPVRELAGHYALLVDLLTERLPGVRIHLQSVLPCGSRRTERVRALNDAIRAVARIHGLPYIDLYPAFASGDGALRAELAEDEIHLNEEGYRRWAEAIRPWVLGDGDGAATPPS